MKKRGLFVCRDWTGEPGESEEMAPQWYDLTDIPYGEMWEDDKFWLPQVLAGQYVNDEFLFDSADAMLDMAVAWLTAADASQIRILKSRRKLESKAH